MQHSRAVACWGRRGQGTMRSFWHLEVRLRLTLCLHFAIRGKERKAAAAAAAQQRRQQGRKATGQKGYLLVSSRSTDPGHRPVRCDQCRAHLVASKQQASLPAGPGGFFASLRVLHGRVAVLISNGVLRAAFATDNGIAAPCSAPVLMRPSLPGRLSMFRTGKKRS